MKFLWVLFKYVVCKKCASCLWMAIMNEVTSHSIFDSSMDREKTTAEDLKPHIEI